MKLARLLILLFSTFSVFAQSELKPDTLTISLQQADSLLITRNLTLISFHFEIDKAEAQRIQASIFDNPVLSTEWNLYNPKKAEWFDVNRSGQKIIGIEQVFKIAGQRSAAIRLAAEDKKISESQYTELVRALRYELHVTFYRYHYLNNAIAHIQSQLGLLKSLIDVYDEQYKKGNISLQELTRLNAAYFTINNQVKEVRQELIKLQQTLRVLLNEDAVVMPVLTQRELHPPVTIELSDLLQRAEANRPELRTIKHIQTQQELRYALARKEAIPNVTAGVLYDQAGSYVNNYTALTVGLQIPLFNRNQGVKQSAKIGIQQSKIMYQSKEQEIESEVISAWNNLNVLDEQYAGIGNNYDNELNQLSEGLVNNYSRNNISLLEFTDLFETYNTNIIQYNQLKAELNEAYEELVYVVGDDLR